MTGLLTGSVLLGILAAAPATKAPNASVALERAIIRMWRLQGIAGQSVGPWDTTHAIEDVLPLLAREPAKDAFPSLIRLQSYRLGDYLVTQVQCWMIRVGIRGRVSVPREVPASTCLAGHEGPPCQEPRIYERLVKEAFRYIRQRKRCELDDYNE